MHQVGPEKRPRSPLGEKVRLLQLRAAALLGSQKTPGIPEHAAHLASTKACGKKASTKTPSSVPVKALWDILSIAKRRQCPIYRTGTPCRIAPRSCEFGIRTRRLQSLKSHMAQLTLAVPRAARSRRTIAGSARARHRIEPT